MGRSKDLNQIIIFLLKPIVRFAMRRGMRFQEISEGLKAALVSTAKSELARSDKGKNVSRISVMTGLHRKDVSRIELGGLKDTSGLNLLARILGQWQSHPDYKLPNGKPKSLGLTGNDSEFAELVRTVSHDVSPYTVLFGLEEAGAVKRSGDKVSLIKEAYSVPENVEASLSMLASDSNDLMQAVDENIFAQEKIPNLHVTTSYDNICQDKLAEIRDWLLDQGSAFHERAREYLSKFDKDANPRLYKSVGGARVSLCAFSFTEKGKEENKDAKGE